MSGKNKNNENIQVYVRCRPINSRERAIHSNEVIKVLSDREVVVKQQLDNRISKKFTFDRAFGPESKQADVYQVVVAPLINQVLTGYNCTVFAYGQTGTGKTHTMIGDETPQNTSSYEDLSAMGIIPRAVSHMFEELRTMGVEFTMRISYLELYNEELCDLLSSNDVTQIRIFEDPNKKGSIIVQGLEEIPVHSTSDVYKLLAKGQEKRRMATTLMSAQSSRSHTVFSVLVHIKEKDGIEGEELLKVGKLNLVDLAGSENISKAGNEKGIRTRETVNINQSLLTLGRVITALVERTPHIPYRESKLTRLLQESLGGRTKTSIIATISPGHKDLEETTSTLEYANRAKNIQNKPEVNQKLTKQTVMKEYTEEIDRLKRDLMAARDKNGFFIAEETYNQMIYQLESQKTELTDQINKLKAEKEKVNQQQQKLAEINTELIARTEELEESENKLLRTNDNLERAKRGYLEKKQIILKQEQTEKTLTSQAKQLLDVANTVTTDVKKLHETISRRKNFDINNREACKNLDSNLNSHFSAMSSNINEYNSALCDQTTSLFKKLNSNTQQNKNICVAILAKINTLIDAEQQAKRDISECIAGGKSGLENIFQKYTEEQNRIMKDVAEQKKQLKQQLDHLQTDYDQTYEQLQQKHSHFQTLQKEHTNFVNDHQSRVRQNLLTQSGTFVSAFESNYETLTSTTKQHEELSCKLSTMFDEIKNLMDKSRAKNQTIKEATNDMKNATNRFKTGFKKDINTACDEFKTKVTENGEKINGVMVDCEAAARNLKSNTTEMMRVSSNNDEQLMANINEMNKKFEEQKNILGDKLYEMLDKVDNTSEMTRINIEGGLQSIVDDATAEQENLDTQHFELEDTINTLDATHKEFHESVKSDIDSCTKRLQTFRNDEVQVYTPTSQTPSKREYNYPKVLTKTSPKAKIVADFWSTHNSNDLDCSVIIAEDPTEDTVLANSSNATNSLLYTSALESDRTLCESRIFNVNSMSTPIVNLPKPNTVQNESNIEPIASVSEEHKEN